MTKIVQLVNSCRECPNRHYYSGGAYECEKVQGSRLNADSSIPAWCPLPEYRAGSGVRVPLRVHEVLWDGAPNTYEVRKPGRGTADDYEPGECLGVFETRTEAEAFAAAGVLASDDSRQEDAPGREAVLVRYAGDGKYVPVGVDLPDPIRYDRLHQYAQENRLDYNELCRVVRVAAAPAIKDSNRYRWLRDRPCLSVFTGESIRFRPFDCPHEIEVGQIGATDLDEAIDAQLTLGVALPDGAKR